MSFDIIFSGPAITSPKSFKGGSSSVRSDLFTHGHLVEGLAYVVYVGWINASHWDPAIWRHVDSVVLDDLCDHLGLEPSVSKHSDLIRDVGPVMSAAQVF